MTITISTERATELAAEYDDLRTRRDQAIARMADILAELRGLGAGSHTAGTFKVSVAPNRRFDVELARRTLPAETIALCTEPVLSAAKVKQVIPPAAYEALMVEVGEPKVTVR